MGEKTHLDSIFSPKIYEKHLNSVHFKMNTYLLKEFLCVELSREFESNRNLAF